MVLAAVKEIVPHCQEYVDVGISCEETEEFGELLLGLQWGEGDELFELIDYEQCLIMPLAPAADDRYRLTGFLEVRRVLR